MKLKTLAVAALIAAGLGAAAVFASPMVALRLAESEVDEALSDIRKRNTAVVHRGAVSVDLGARAITIRDLSIDSPGNAPKLTIGVLTIVRPARHDEKLTADTVVLENVRMQSPNESAVAPRIEIQRYSGPIRGLVATPGAGQAARTQAETIAEVSVERAVVPSIEIVNRGAERRSVADVVIERVTNGLVARASVGSVSVRGVAVSNGQLPDAGLTLRVDGAVSQELSLPALWRFYAGDGVGQREPLFARAWMTGLKAELASEQSGRVSVTADRLDADAVAVRAFARPGEALGVIEGKQQLGDRPVPADIRRRLLLAVDASRAVALERIAVSNLKIEAAVAERPTVSGGVARWEAGPYADGRLGAIKAQGLSMTARTRTVALDRSTASAIDVSGLAAYAERVGRDETLLTPAPAPTEVVRLLPRLAALDVGGLTVTGPGAAFKLESGRLNLNGPADDVPHRLALTLDGIDLTPAESLLRPTGLRAAGVGRLTGRLDFALTFDPKTSTVTLDPFEYRFAQLATVTATGGLGRVDPTLVSASGADWLDKLSNVTVTPLRLKVRDHGAVQLLLDRAAAAAGEPVDAFRTSFADRTAAATPALFGPFASASGEALARFIRDPKSIEVTIQPKQLELPLIDLLRAVGLGPEGIAQTIDVVVRAGD